MTTRTVIRYTVTRYCCMSGLCFECHARGNHGSLEKRARVIQAAGLTLRTAKKFMDGWRAYGAQLIKERHTQESKP